MRNLLMALAALGLTGCGASTYVEPPKPDLPPSLTATCAAPTRLPERQLSDQEVEVYWGRDRSALRACQSKHAGLVSAIEAKGKTDGDH